MSKLEDRLSSLSQKQRALLELKLKMKRMKAANTDSVIQRRASDSNIPMSYSQRALWFADQLESGKTAYNIAISIRLKGKLNVSALEHSLSDIIIRHDALRTIFKNDKGNLIQEIVHSTNNTFFMHDFSQVFSEEKENTVQKILDEEGKHLFNLAQGPLIRNTLIKLGPWEHILSIVVHHIVFDSWSMMVFFKELKQFYTKYSLKENLQPEELSIQYADYAVYQHERINSEHIQSKLSYWKKKLKGAPYFIPLPTDHSRPKVQTFRGKRLYFMFPDKLMDDLRILSRREDATVYMTLLAAWKSFLYRLTGQEDIVVGTPTAGRYPETENLIGFFVNTLPMRTNLSGNPTFRELISRVRQTALEAYDNQEVPFEMIIDSLGIEHSPSFAPLSQVRFIYQNVPGMDLELPNLDVQFLQTDTGTSKFDLMLDVTDSPKGVIGRIEYSTELFNHETIQRMLAQFLTLLESIVGNCEQQIGKLSMINGEERKDRKMKSKKKELFNNKKLFTNKPKAIKISSEQLVTSSYLDPAIKMPLVMQPNSHNINLTNWVLGKEDEINKKLIEHGGILFRGFQIESTEEFEKFTKQISPNLLNYYERSTPRTEVSGKVYTSTEYPADQFIPQHSEMSYSSNWPKKIGFYCVTAPKEKGETPLADNRKVFDLLDSEIKKKFMEKKVLYVRNYGAGLDLTWQNAFQTDDPVEVEQYCYENNIEYEWLEEGRLRTKQLSQAVEKHPVTGEMLWFNQAHLFHVSNLPTETRDSLLSVMSDEELPRNAYYGDGSPIENEVLEAIREAYRQALVVFPWEKGDVLMLDNMLISHGRSPFVGPRKVVVAMGDPYRN